MKKVLLFLAIFGSGLAVLLFFVFQQRQEKQERVPKTTAEVEAPENMPFTPIPDDLGKPETDAEEGEQGSSIAGTLSGWAEFTVFEQTERGHRLYDIHIQNADPLGEDLYDLEGITGHTYNPDDETLEATLVAKRGRARIEFRDAKFAVGRSETVKLYDAVVILHQGAPMAPLTLTLPSMQGDLEHDLFTSEATVDVVGQGIHATGLGVIADQSGEALRFIRDGHVRLEVDETREVEVLATGLGPMTVSRTELIGGIEFLELIVSDGARVLMEGEERFTLDSRELVMNGATREVLRDGEQQRVFTPSEAVADGEVIARHADGELQGGHAVAEFDELGEIKRVTVTEEPVLGGEMLATVERGAEPQLVWLELTGEGPLVVDYVASEGDAAEDSATEGANPDVSADFDMQGPAAISARGIEFNLAASEKIDGRFFEDKRAIINLRGAVQGLLQGTEFVGSNVVLKGQQSDDEQRLMSVETEGPAHVEGEDAAGRPFVLDTQGSLRARIDQAQLHVPLANQAKLVVTDDGQWAADVGVMHDLDLEQGSFRAEEGMVVTSPYGVTHALRGIGHSREHLELFGTPESDEAERVPVRVVLEEGALKETDSGLLRAMHVVLKRDYARATDSVELRMGGLRGEQEIDCEWAELKLEGDPQLQPETPFRFEAREVKRGLLRDEDGVTLVSARKVTGHGVIRRDEEGKQRAELLELIGAGGVTVSFTGETMFTSAGERFVWTPENGGHLEEQQGKRVEARGRFTPEGPRYLLTATWIEFVEGRIEALAPRIVQDLGEQFGVTLPENTDLELRSAVADWMAADEHGLLLSGNAHFEGLTRTGRGIELDATSLHLDHNEGTPASPENFEHLVAWDGFVLRMGEDFVGRGEVFEVGYDTLRLEGRPAKLEMQGFVLESYNIVYDVPRVLITTDQGRFTGAAGSEWEGWTATYESLQPFDHGDTTVMAMRHPVLTKGTEVVRSNWALLWADRDEWIGSTATWLGQTRKEEPEAEAAKKPEEAEEPVEHNAPTLFGRVKSRELSKILKEIYLEGNVEYLVEGDRVAKLDAAYIDLVDGHGWFRNCEFWIRTSIRGVPTRIAARAELLHHSADGTLSADEAKLTDCEFAEPDYFVRTRNLRMKPAGDGSSVWDVLLQDNSLEFDNGAKLPLPRVHYKSDGKGLPTFGGLRFGDSARFGTFVQATVNTDIGETVAGAVASVSGLETEQVDGDWSFRASYYDLRGPLLGTTFRVRAADKFWMNLYTDGVLDTGNDVGIIKSKTSSTTDFRWVIHSRGRYMLEPGEWIDLQFATQSDPGVQSEFYEGSFIHYDKRDTFLRWRKADDANYYSANARIRADSFRSDVERLPDLGALHGLTPIAQVVGVPLLYTASVDAAYLSRKGGDPNVFSPFDPVFDDGLGDRDYLRADTRHRVEAPFDIGAAGVQLTPYTSFAATAWSEGVDQDTSPSRGALIAGAEAQTTLFRTWRHGVINDVTPMVGVRADLGTFDADGTPIRVDPIDQPLEGKYIDLGARSRWRAPLSNRRLDIAATLSHATDVAEGVEEGWQPIAVLADFLAVAKGIPFIIRHDARYDLDDGETTQSYTGLSLLPWETIGFEWAYHRGLDDNRDLYYDAMTLGARWEASPKWQVEGRQTMSRITNSNLNSTLVVRRIGHEFIFEVQYGFRAGEGSSSLGFSIRPQLGWRRPGFGLVDTLKSLRL